ncbi:phosphatase PAP2 family protein [Quadrisphaera sp. KR29]|uniref:phosphatase PAP2 family protein n=1 Tax=Quadrisphaera sp. KR29 TaxID=3461391 RepID=UPI004044326C
MIAAAVQLGRFGDHAAGWVALGAAGWLLDAGRRPLWARALVSVLGAHAATVVLKRLVRRLRPGTDEAGTAVRVRSTSPSRLSFPSSHAASTTAAALAYGRLLRLPLAPVVVPAQGVSRVLLGLHFPTDVLVGTLTGVVADRLVAARGGAR